VGRKPLPWRTPRDLPVNICCIAVPFHRTRRPVSSALTAVPPAVPPGCGRAGQAEEAQGARL
jgi:hypothetical protein